MNIKQISSWATNKLLAKKIKTAALDAEVLLSFVLNKPKEFLYTHPEYKLTKQQITRFKQLVSRRSKCEPVAYLKNTKEFYGLDFLVDKRVLIPRPETELLVEEVLKQLRAQSSELRAVADIGTGSGCIIISLAKALMEHITCYATDISQKALQVAKLNAKQYKVKMRFYHGNLLEPLKNEKIDIVVANLPYGWKQWNNNTSAETSSLKFEPQQALFTKENGLYFYRLFLEQLAKRVQKPKLVFIEFDPRQTSSLKKLIKKYLQKSKLEIKKDLAGLNRLLIIKL